MSQYDAREVADLLSRFNFKILRDQEGDFSPSHRKYLCEFIPPALFLLRRDINGTDTEAAHHLR